MKILITGVNGQLGYDVAEELKNRKIEHLGTCREDFDITNFEQAKKFIMDYKPDVIIHCAAYTAVDKAEDEKDLCYKVNFEATENIAEICKEIDAKLIYISTDYIFSGAGDSFYEVNDAPEPIGVYGASKLAGENAVKKLLNKYFIVRISWVFGINGNNFVKTMLRLGKENNEIKVVSDQIGAPTYTADLAKLLCDMAVTEKYGTYHATNEGVCSWAEFAEEILKQAGLKTKVKYITTNMYPTKAKRPHNSRLSKKALDDNMFARLPEWKDALGRFLKKII